MRYILIGVAGVLAAATVLAPVAASADSTSTSAFPHYDHVFLLINENHGYNQIIGNPAAPEINALAADYGLATSYTGVGDPREPNYVAMLGGSTFGINSDDPYFFPGHTINQPNLMSQLDAAGLSWKGYFQDMPYPASPNPGTGDNGFAAITAIPGGSLWAAGITARNRNYSTLIQHHC